MTADDGYRPRRAVRNLVHGCRLLPMLALLVATLSPAAAQPYRPMDDGEVLERLPVLDRKVAAPLRRTQAALRAEPQNVDLALSVARQNIALGRAEGDPRYYGYAQAALAPWWSRDDAPVRVLVLRAVLRQAGHDFTGALNDLDRALAAKSGHAQAWLTRAIILRVQGRYAEALDSCKRLGRRVAPIVALACTSALESMAGDADGSYRRLAAALAAASHADPELRIWCRTILADIAARQGRSAAAEAHLRDALAPGVRNTYVLGALADLLLDQERFAEVRELLDEETRVDPLLLRLALAEAALGDARTPEHRAMLAARFAAARLRGDARHLREEARFALELLNEPERALRLALENWQTQREPEDVRLVLASALAAGNASAAEPVLDWLEARQLEAVHIDRLVDRLKKARG